MLHRLLVAAGLASNPRPTTPWPLTATVVSPPKPTESAIVAETVSGSHVLTIKGYCPTKGLGKGEFITSSIFKVGGCSWSIFYYPDGRGANNTGWISVFLELIKSPGNGIVAKAWCRLALLDGAGKPVPGDICVSDGIHRFVGNGVSWGSYRLISKTALEQSPYLQNDCFSIRCDLTVYKDIRKVDGAAGRFVSVPPSSLKKNLERLLKSGAGADVTFEVAGTTVAAHRYILAVRSPVFMAELFGPMKEKDSACVRIDDMEAGVFNALLYFVYTDEFPKVEDGDDKVDMAQHLLVAADRYSLDRLKLMCEDKLCGYVDINNVGTVLALAEQHECEGLKKACFEFLMTGSNLEAAMSTTGFEHLSASCHSIVKELLAKAAIVI